MIEEGRTDFDLSIIIPNTKSRSNMNLNERLMSELKTKPK